MSEPIVPERVADLDGQAVEIFRLPTDEVSLEAILRELFEQHWHQITFGPIIQGAAWEIRAPHAPSYVGMMDGYLTVALGISHLDLPGIEWLERELAELRSGIVLISPDRRLLERFSRRTVWLDRGITRMLEQGFASFEGWRDAILEQEESEQHKLGRKIAMEEWARAFSIPSDRHGTGNPCEVQVGGHLSPCRHCRAMLLNQLRRVGLKPMQAILAPRD
jgi:hypothetical protein